MKIRIKTFNGELPSYLTVGKVYGVRKRSINDRTFFLDDDDGDTWVCRFIDCALLNGGSWEVVSE